MCLEETSSKHYVTVYPNITYFGNELKGGEESNPLELRELKGTYFKISFCPCQERFFSGCSVRLEMRKSYRREEERA